MASKGKIKPTKKPVPGWKGGFSSSNSKFKYPKPDLSSLQLLHNMDNIPLLKRQLDVLWPEFSWQTIIGDESSRCYQMFAPDISRAGYDDAGRIFSIICPQQGAHSATLGNLNIEVTVNNNRGWVNEKAKGIDTNPFTAELLFAEMSVTGKIWFSPDAKQMVTTKLLKLAMEHLNLPFPDNKANAIQVVLHRVGDPTQPVLQIRSGINPLFKNPPFATHEDEAWSVANVAVQIGSILSHNNPIVDDFNATIMDIFNLASGNLLQNGNILTWNVWLDAPTYVDQIEWRAHAEIWRHSIDTGHGSPDGRGTTPRYFNGAPFDVVDTILEEELDLIRAFLKKHFPWLARLSL